MLERLPEPQYPLAVTNAEALLIAAEQPHHRSFPVNLSSPTITEIRIFLNGNSPALSGISSPDEHLYGYGEDLLSVLEQKFHCAASESVGEPCKIPPIELSEWEVSRIGNALLGEVGRRILNRSTDIKNVRAINYPRDAFFELKKQFIKAGGQDRDGELEALEVKFKLLA